MIIKQLELENFMGYRRRCYLDFRNKKIIGITGNNESGKSTILSAICYALFGDIPQLNSEAREITLISENSNKNLLVSIEVELSSGEVLSLSRGRTKDNTPIVRLHGENGKPSEISNLIESKIGITFDDFIALAYFVQGDIHQFMTGNKGEYFRKWASKLHLWEKFRCEAVARFNELSMMKKKLARDISWLEESISDERKIKTAIADLITEQSEAEITKTSLNSKIEETSKKLNAIYTSQASKKTATQILTAELAGIEATLKSATVKRDALFANFMRDTCPILKKKCPDLSLRKSQSEKIVAAADSEIAQLVARREEIKEEIKKNIAVSNSELVEYEHALDSLKSKLNKNDLVRKAIQKQLGSLDNQLQELELRKKRIKEVKKELVNIEQEISHYNFIIYMCGKSGIPSEIMIHELQAVEDKCNWVLSCLDYPKKIKFAAFRELATLESICPRCGESSWKNNSCSKCGEDRPHKHKDDPFISIIENGVEQPFSLESGGAKVLQSFAVRLACGLFLADMTGNKVQMIMLDEIFAMLDSENRRKLMDVVINKLSSKFGLRQQFIVSHQEDIVNSVNHIIRVSKQQGSSVAEWE